MREEEEEDENNKILGTRTNEEEAASIDDAAHFVCTVVVSLLISTYFHQFQAFSFNAFSKTRKKNKNKILFSFLHSNKLNALAYLQSNEKTQAGMKMMMVMNDWFYIF